MTNKETTDETKNKPRSWIRRQEVKNWQRRGDNVKKRRRSKEEMKEEGQFPSSLIQSPSNLLTQVLYKICFWVARRVASLIICLQHRSHSSPSLFSRVTLVQNLSQSETPQFVFHADMWHLVTHVNYDYCCYTELFRRLERFRPTKHKHWGCACLLYSSKHSAQQFSTILAYHTRIILARCITLHMKQAPNLT